MHQINKIILLLHLKKNLYSQSVPLCLLWCFIRWQLSHWAKGIRWGHSVWGGSVITWRIILHWLQCFTFTIFEEEDKWMRKKSFWWEGEATKFSWQGGWSKCLRIKIYLACYDIVYVKCKRPLLLPLISIFDKPYYCIHTRTRQEIYRQI